MDAAQARDRLEQERTRLSRLRAEAGGEATEFGFGESADDTGALNDQMGGDAATHMHDREVASSILEHLDAELEEIELALQRVEDGSYGICEIGGDAIPDERLEVLPHARWCAQHAKQGEAQRGIITRGTGGLSAELERQRRNP
jgi:DnaK suppressor protein